MPVISAAPRKRFTTSLFGLLFGLGCSSISAAKDCGMSNFPTFTGPWKHIFAFSGSRVKGGVKPDHKGGVKVDQYSMCRRPGIVGEEGGWSGGLRRLQGGEFRPERKTSSSPRRVRRRGSGQELRRPVVGSGVRR